VPDEVHFFFVSPKRTSLYEGFNLFPILSGSYLAANETECVPMGDGCFHPQLGFVEGDAGAGKKDQILKPLKTINSSEVDLVKCDKGNYFDIFCGKATGGPSRRTGVEVWIDTSSSMRNIDYNSDPQFCERRTIVKKVRDACGEKINFQIFDTAKKELGVASGSCQNYGLNNQKKMIKWIKDSNAKVVYLITDIDEYSIELRDFLVSISAQIYGGDFGAYSMKDLQQFMDGAVSKYCK